MEHYKLLDILTLSATILVESGSEISRVNQTVFAIASPFGISDTGIFVTPTGLLISFDYEGHTYSRIKSVTVKGFDVEKINQVNHLARNFRDLDLDQFREKLIVIQNTHGYPDYVKCLAGAGIALCFTLFFGGDFIAGIWAFMIGYFMQYFKIVLERNNFNTMIKIIVLSSYFTMIPLVLLHMGLISSQDSIITGCLMLVVPGLALIGAIRDSIAGNTLSGLVRGFEALLVSVGIVIGTTAVLLIHFELIKGGIIK